MEAASRAQSVYALAQSWSECAPVSETCTRAAAALAGGDGRAAGDALRCAQALPGYGAWLGTLLADVAPQALRTALAALLAALPRDPPAALAAQAAALETL